MENIAVETNKNRNSSLDLLRILSMFGIVLSHYASHGIKHVLSADISLRNEWLNGTFINQLFVNMLEPFGEIGNVIFFMLMGYFLFEKKQDLRKIPRLLYTALFYLVIAVLVQAVFRITGIYSFSELPLIKTACYILFPFNSHLWWFLSVYVWIYLVFDKINFLLDGIAFKKFTTILILSLFFMYFVPMLTSQPFSSLQRGVFGYALGFFTKKFLSKNGNLRLSWIWILFVICASSIFLLEVTDIFLRKGIVTLPINSEYVVLFFRAVMLGFLAPIIAFCIFLVFSYKKMRGGGDFKTHVWGLSSPCLPAFGKRFLVERGVSYNGCIQFADIPVYLYRPMYCSIYFLRVRGMGEKKDF